MEYLAELAAKHYSFLLEQLHTPIGQFVLKFAKSHQHDIKFMAQQLNGLQKAKKKLPSWFHSTRTLYPPQLNLAQSSSEITAKYKASLLPEMALSADLTGGFGVDSFYISQKSLQHYYFEENEDLANCVQINFKTFGIKNISLFTGNSLLWLQKENIHFQAIYIDPSRRVEGQRKFKLADCTPNIIEVQYILLSKASEVLSKLSPMVDLSQLVNTLKNIAEIHIVAVKNECKEVLVLQKRDFEDEPIIKTINFGANNEYESFTFKQSDERRERAHYAKAKRYIYEPNVAILKSGAFKYIAAQFQLEKLRANTQLYTSETIKGDFPGRCFEVLDEPLKEVNIIIRNHPQNASQLLKKYKCEEGSEHNFLIAFTDIEKPKVAFCRKVN